MDKQNGTIRLDSITYTYTVEVPTTREEIDAMFTLEEQIKIVSYHIRQNARMKLYRKITGQ